MAELRDAYLQILRFEGLRSITFTTKDENYKWFVEQLNAYKVD
jgi:cell division protein FtsX